MYRLKTRYLKIFAFTTNKNHKNKLIKIKSKNL